MGNKRKKKLQTQVGKYLKGPLYFIGFWIMINVITYAIDVRAGAVMSLATFVYIILMLSIAIKYNSNVTKRLIDFGSAYSLVQRQMIKEMDVPYGLIDENGKILWTNNQFDTLFEKSVLNKNIMNIFEGIKPEYLVFDDEKPNHVKLSYKDKLFAVTLTKFELKNDFEDSALNLLEENSGQLISIYLRDETLISKLEKETKEERLVTANIYIDNYDEIIDSVEEVRQSLLVALVDRKINQYIAKANGIVKKMETDKYFIAVQKQHFKQLEEDKFSLLEGVKTVNIGNKIPATISMGFGLSEESYAQSYNYARVAIDLSLARGGDQAVIKDSQGITYYGGKREQTSKNTRVKARVKAEALREFITIKDKIFVMGHKFADADSFGAAVGICRAAEALEKKAYIVIDEISASLKPLYLSYAENPEYGEKMFLKPQEVLKIADENSMVVVVDTNRPKMTECEELLSIARTIVVLDHHRQSSDNIENALLSYIEPYASSSCEMVAEILQYIVDDIEIPELEASSLYAGIMIDTNNFVNKTGVRTFEAAAFLRRCGANITQVRKMFRDDMASYQAKAEIISSVEVYQEKFAIARGENLDIESPTIVGAQAANDLLDINAVKASFVLTNYNGRIYISARSIDEVNVQIIMERLGGGGHMNASGAQFEHTDMERAIEDLKKVIDEMVEGGDI